ncbi:MAG: hypothetical protein LBI35_02905 [Burkholderiales bacterium]|jgi:hypothetical protein|nr:hypothetical protein [Burkholderiales bacterium]
MSRFFLLTHSGAIGLLTAALTLFAPAAFSSEIPSDIRRVEGMPFISTKAEEVVSWRSVPNTRNIAAVTFIPMPESALKMLQEENSQDSNDGFRTKALMIGVNRNADTEISDAKPLVLNWQSIGDGHIARLAITSPEARGMRVALRLRVLPDSAELRFSGSAEPERIIGVISGKEANALRDDDNVYWTPVTEGETQNIEIYLPSAVRTEDVKIRLNAVSHLFTSAQDGFNTAHLVKASQACQINVACRSGSLGTSFQNTSTAVAKMTFTVSAGRTGLCTGTLLSNTSRSGTPYFWSAAHCISTQPVANTLNTHWFYEAANCYGASPGSGYRQLVRGAAILHASVSTDTLLLRLNDTPPAGAWLAGWDSNRFSTGAITAIHHPSGDIKKVSFGKGEGRTCNTTSIAEPGLNMSTFSVVSWSQGSTEGGSSGSGLFTESNGQYYLRGGLMGGYASCANMNGPPVNYGNIDCYSGLDRVWDDIKQYLAPVTQPQYNPSRNYSGQWIKADEDGWGLSVIMGFSDQRYIFVPWYTYDNSGRAQWYLFQGPAAGYGDWTANDTFEASVYRYTGSTWHTIPWNNNSFSGTKVGTAKLTFTSATRATFEYDIGGARRTITLDKIP